LTTGNSIIKEVIFALSLSTLFPQSIIGTWDMIAPYTKEINGKQQSLIRHHYYANGSFELFIWHQGHFQYSGEGTYTAKKERLNHKVEDETYSGELDFPTDSTMTIRWDGEKAVLQFKRLPNKPDA